MNDLIHLSDRLKNLPTNFFAQIEKRIESLQAEGSNIIRLDIGSPDLPPHPSVIQSLNNSSNLPTNHGYQAHLGPDDLRAAWSKHYDERFGVKLDPGSEILPLLGSKEGIFHLSMVCLDPLDKVLVPDPGYMTYSRGANFAGAIPVYYPLKPARSFLPVFEEIPAEQIKDARLLWMNFPNNPTGATADLAFFKEAVNFAQKNNIILVHDNAYAQICFDDYRAPSIFEIPGAKDIAVEFNSLSKSHNMPGWRSGVVVGNSKLIKALYKLKSNIDSGGFRPVWDASTEALGIDQKWVIERNAIYKTRRDVVINAFSEMSLEPFTPRGSIYVWTSVPKSLSSVDFCVKALETAAVSLTPGTVFGPAGEGYIRIALTQDTAKIQEAMKRLIKYFKDL